jgi:hypothetical protein
LYTERPAVGSEAREWSVRAFFLAAVTAPLQGQ